MAKGHGQDFMDTTVGLIGAWMLYLAVTAFVGAWNELWRIRTALTPKV